MKVWSTLLSFIDTQGSASMATIVNIKGSTPREIGARIIVAPNGDFRGTIGGGTLEWEAIKQLRNMLAKDNNSCTSQHYSLGPRLGQCCGGSVEVLFEAFMPDRRKEIEALVGQETKGFFQVTSVIADGRVQREISKKTRPNTTPAADPAAFVETFGTKQTPLYLFGAGHVAKALMLSLAPLPFEVTWIDERDDIFPPHTPSNFTCRYSTVPENMLNDAPKSAMVLIMTHSHDRDLSLATQALKRSDFSYVGVIGSETKAARFKKRLGHAGLLAPQISQLRCPIGYEGISGKDPASIAVAVAAELLMRKETLDG